MTRCTYFNDKKNFKQTVLIHRNTYTLLDSINHRFDSAIRDFELADSIVMPEKNIALFIGSSSIRLWKSLPEDMSPIPVINRGFGGATTSEVLQYADRIIVLYQPKVIVFYAGENDIANDYIPATAPFGAFIRFAEYIENLLPDTHILYISMKPSPKRWKFWNKFAKCNNLIRFYAEEKKQITYADVSSHMIGINEKPNQYLFTKDSLHLNENGYVIWKNIIKSHLDSIFFPKKEMQR